MTKRSTKILSFILLLIACIMPICYGFAIENGPRSLTTPIFPNGYSSIGTTFGMLTLLFGWFGISALLNESFKA